MLDIDGSRSVDGSSCSSRHSLALLSEQGPSASPAGSTTPSLPPFDSAHVRVIPSLHHTLPSSAFKYLQVQTLTKDAITLAVHNAVVENRPFLVVYLRVRIYVDRVVLIRCPIALHHYYLQLRENLLDQWSGSNSVSEERCWEMAALALQADHTSGDHCNDQNFRAEQYFPLWVINMRGLDFVRRNMPAIRNDLRPCSTVDATLEYCHEASRSPFALNCHLYGLRRHKMDTVDNAIIGITPKGIDMSDVGNDGERIPLRSLRWGRMAKLSFDKRKLTITGMDGACVSLYAQSEQKARYLLEFCRALHQAIISINNHYLLNPYAYPADVSSSSFSCGDERSVDGPLCSRRSLVSHTSSNSTSGVVSDKPSSEPDKVTGSIDVNLKNPFESPACFYHPEVVHIRRDQGECSEASRVASECSYGDSQRATSLSDVVTDIERISLSRRISEDTSTEIESKPSVAPTTTPRHTAERSVESTRSDRCMEGSDGHAASSTISQATNKSRTSSESVVAQPEHAPSKHRTPSRNSCEELRCLGGKQSSVESSSGSPPPIPHSLPPPLVPSATTLQYNIPRTRGRDSEAGSSTASTTGSHAGGCGSSGIARTGGLSDVLGIRQPPLYSEAVSIAQRGVPPTIFDDYHPQMHRPNANPHMKPRWTTVTGVCAGDCAGGAICARDLESHCSGFACSAVHLARSEPKLDQQGWSRPGSPLMSVSPSSGRTLLRPTPANTPPFVGGNTGAGLFQKQSRSAVRSAQTHNARGINRVQSMPAHNPHHMHSSGDSAVSPSAALHHAHSLAARPATLETKQPPSYEHAILQARARCAAHRAGASSNGGVGTTSGGGLDRELVHEGLPLNPTSNEKDEDLSLKSRIGQFPMMRALWQEQQQGIAGGVSSSGVTGVSGIKSVSSPPPPLLPPPPPPPLTTSSGSSGLDRLSVGGGDPCSSMSSVCTSLNADLLDSLLTPHLRRPSSCQDLSSSPFMLTPPHSAPMHSSMLNGTVAPPSAYGYGYMPPMGMNMNMYMRPAPIAPPPVYRGEYYFDHAQLYRHYVPMHSANMAHNSWTPSQSVLDLPPPPPYPPPRSSPSPREAPMVM